MNLEDEQALDELKACPFCGSSNTTLDYYEISCPQELGTIVVCNDCGASAASIVDWNTRPIEDALHARIAELESAQRWIPVSERLPELDQDVFAVVEGEIKVGHFYQELDFIEPDDDDEEGNIYFSVFDDGLLVATHWFPIPDGLEESEE